MNLSEITHLLNKLSNGYEIGKLQSIRKDIKGLKRRAGSGIFSEILHSSKYAFHLGGRKELQFNIGYEDQNKFRYGIAFSLETSQFFHDVESLFGRIKCFNEFFKSNSTMFDSYSAYTEKNKKIVQEYPVNIISQEQYQNHGGTTFFFIGKFFNKTIDEITHDDCHEILKTFDELLKVYLYVETHYSKFE